MTDFSPSSICTTCGQPYSARNGESNGCEEHTEARIELGIDAEQEWSRAEAGAAVAEALDQLGQEAGPWHLSDSALDRLRRLEDLDDWDEH